MPGGPPLTAIGRTFGPVVVMLFVGWVEAVAGWLLPPPQPMEHAHPKPIALTRSSCILFIGYPPRELQLATGQAHTPCPQMLVDGRQCEPIIPVHRS